MSQPVPASPESSKQLARPLPMSDEALLQNVRVASPCSVNWDAMPGGERVRSCAQCNHKVYNLSEMPAADAAQLLRASEGRICVRFYRRSDGTVMTKDCPVGLRAVRQRMARAATLAFSTLFISLGGLSLATRTRSEQPRFLRWALDTVSPQPEPLLLPMAMGEIAREPEPEMVMGAAPAFREPLPPGNSFEDAARGYGGTPGTSLPVAPEVAKPFLRGAISTPPEFRPDPFEKANSAKK